MQRVVLGSASLAPISLIGGWTWAASRQPTGYRTTRDTISALAAHGATDRWIMTSALAVLGLCHLVTAAGLPELGRAARIVLGTGGAATVLVAAFAQPAAGHVPAAAAGFGALALWPALARVPDRRLGLAASAMLFTLIGWLLVELHGGQLLGLSERILAGSQALWPLVAVGAVLTGNRIAAGAGRP